MPPLYPLGRIDLILVYLYPFIISYPPYGLNITNATIAAQNWLAWSKTRIEWNGNLVLALSYAYPGSIFVRVNHKTTDGKIMPTENNFRKKIISAYIKFKKGNMKKGLDSHDLIWHVSSGLKSIFIDSV